MSFATAQPTVNSFLGTGDIASALRTYLLANASNRGVTRLVFAARGVTMTATVRVHPTLLAKKMRRINSLVQDLIN